MRYSLDLSQFTLRSYMELLQVKQLLPGRRILLQDIVHHFRAIAICGIEDLAQLTRALSSPRKLVALAANSGLTVEYLTLLKREIGSLIPKPVPLEDFPGVGAALVSELGGRGIRTSKDLFESNPCPACEMFCLCDLVRINGVGAVAARAFYEAGYRSVADVADADATDMLQKVTRVNNEKGYYRASLGVKDMQFCIDFARLFARYGDTP